MGPWGDGLDPNHRLHMTVHMTVTILLILLLSFGLFLICFCQSFFPSLSFWLQGYCQCQSFSFWLTTVTLSLVLLLPIFFFFYFRHSLILLLPTFFFSVFILLFHFTFVFWFFSVFPSTILQTAGAAISSINYNFFLVLSHTSSDSKKKLIAQPSIHI